MGHVQIIRDFASEALGGPRTVRIYTPDAYDREPERRFPVAYLQDGQHVFAHPESAKYDTWGANEAIEQLAAEGRTEPWILVAADHGSDRFAEYSPWDEPRLGVTAKGPATVKFLTDELKPFVDRHYRTKREPEQTAVMGSSLGGLISLFAGWSRPDVFGRIGGFSPTVMWSLGRLSQEWSRPTGKWSRIYLDVGTLEGVYTANLPLDYPSSVHAFWKHLKAIGYEDWELKLVVEQNGAHHETDWRRRFPEAMAWLLGTW